MHSVKIFELFPTVVTQTTIGRELTKEEIDCLSSQDEFGPAVANYTSANKYILDLPALSSLKQDLNKFVQQYVDEIIKPTNDLKTYITQSWLTITEPGRYHHQHNHPNSFLSGVFYLEVESGKDLIAFEDTSYKQISIESKDWDRLNSPTWKVYVSPGDIVIFPSRLAHSVPNTQTTTNRMSLAFNTFIDGVIGGYNHLTELNVQQTNTI